MSMFQLVQLFIRECKITTGAMKTTAVSYEWLKISKHVQNSYLNELLIFFRYLMIAPTIQQTRCKVWMGRHLPSEVVVSDVTAMYTAICLMGPFSGPLLSELTDEPLDPKSFPFFTYKVIFTFFIIFLEKILLSCF